jgi:hypothetical protein
MSDLRYLLCLMFGSRTSNTTNNVNQTSALLQTTLGKDEPNIVSMRILQRTSQNGTQKSG